MSVETDLYTMITSDAGVAALVGTRVFPLVAGTNAALPLVVYRRTGDAQVRGMGADAMTQSIFRLDCWAVTFSAVKQLSDAVVAAVDRQSAGSIKAILKNDETPIRDDVTGDYRISIGVEVSHA